MRDGDRSSRLGWFLAGAFGLVLAFGAGVVSERGGEWVRGDNAVSQGVIEALAEPRLADSLRRLDRTLARLDDASLPDVVEALEANLTTVREIEIRRIAEAWAEVDAPGAFERLLHEWSSRPVRDAALAAVTYTWALRDPIAAEYAVEQIENTRSELSLVLSEELVAGWVHSPAAPLLDDYLLAQPRSPARQKLILVAARERLRRDGPEGVIAWAEAISPEAPNDYRLVVFRKAAWVLTSHVPERAAAWVGRHYLEEDAEGAPRIVATKWVETDGRRAVEWVLSLSPDWQRDHALEWGFRLWNRYDPGAARKWLESVHAEGRYPAPALEPAIDMYARALAAQSPEQALEWAGLLSDEERRTKALTQIGQTWYRADPEAARAWLDTDALPEEKRQIVESVRPRASRRPPG